MPATPDGATRACRCYRRAARCARLQKAMPPLRWRYAATDADVVLPADATLLLAYDARAAALALLYAMLVV